ncbi:Coproporphyrinogen-III oxidase [Sporothrix epigloea]|uniref:Coproporphyrinogen-III oxidase n=1 Tax=Sporothrix epigloea TaxID=1892477 RepID=A0ABP0D6E5_9PEZI
MANYQAPALPAPRAVLAGLIGAIAAPSTASSSAGDNDVHAQQRRDIDGRRPLLAVLHVLYPALTLPALDLLDRRRVVRWGERRSPGSVVSASSPSSSCTPPLAGPPLYQIRGGGDRPHVVHLRAWHCTCAVFALQAATPTPAATDVDAAIEANATAGDDASFLHQFENTLAHLPFAFRTPPCKHLLACLLAEEWAALDGYVVVGKDQTAAETDATGCSPETLAGIVAGVL